MKIRNLYGIVLVATLTSFSAQQGLPQQPCPEAHLPSNKLIRAILDKYDIRDNDASREYLRAWDTPPRVDGRDGTFKKLLW